LDGWKCLGAEKQMLLALIVIYTSRRWVTINRCFPSCSDLKEQFLCGMFAVKNT